MCKTYCDKCGEEIAGMAWLVEIWKPVKDGYDTTEIELCGKCGESFEEMANNEEDQ